MLVDLHCHSNCSDGALSPLTLIHEAELRGVEILSITDHDNMDAYQQINEVNTKLRLIKGIEFSTTWRKIGIHVLGLNIQGDLTRIIELQKKARVQRAHIITDRLKRHGLIDAFDTITKYKKAWQIGRPDFARLLVEQGLCKNVQDAFKKLLGRGKIGDVKNDWQSLEEIIAGINTAGGFAVLAHPLHYQLTNYKLNELVQDFILLGGNGLEIVNGYQNPDKTNYLIKLSKKFSLKASIGSDFHQHSKWSQLGCKTGWLEGVDVIWKYFDT